MKSDPEIHQRKSIRLKDFDYSQAGGCFVTVVAHLRQNFFGEVQAGKMSLNDAGLMVQAEWQNLSQRFPNIDLDIFQVMPNHFHGIVIIHEPPVGAGIVPAHETGATTRVALTLAKSLGHSNPLRPTNISMVLMNLHGPPLLKSSGSAIIHPAFLAGLRTHPP